MLWLILGLICGFMFALYHIANKKYIRHADPTYFAYWVLIFTAIFAFPFIFILWEHLVLNKMAILFMVFLGVVIVITRPMYLHALNISNVSKTAPLLTLTPIFTLILAMFTLKEFPSTLGILGVILLVFGTYFLNYSPKQHKHILEPFVLIFKHKGSQLMFIVALIYGFGSIIDKNIVLNSNHITRLVLYSFIAMPMFTVYLLFKDGYTKYSQEVKKTIIGHWKGIIFTTVIFYCVIIPQVWAYTMTYVAYIISLKRTAAIFTVIIAYFAFKERKDFWYVLFGTVLMVFGVVLMII